MRFVMQPNCNENVCKEAGQSVLPAADILHSTEEETSEKINSDRSSISSSL